MTVSPFLDAALDYADRGLSVFPLAEGAKVPLKGSNGFHDATTDFDQIEAWWAEHPMANIGILCDSFWVLDEDPRKGGSQSYAEILASQENPAIYTARQRTPSGGQHICFTGRGPKQGDSVNGWQGLDVRSNGKGYIVAAPSVDRAGRRYEWTVSLDDLAPAPTWLVEALGGIEGEDAPENRHAPGPAVERVLPPAERASLESALRVLDPDESYAQWIHVGMALQSTDAGEEAFELWDMWSRQGGKYKGPADLRKHWRSFGKRDQEVTVASLYHYAQESGWEMNGHAAVVDSHQQAPTTADSPLASLAWGITVDAILEGSEPREYLLRRGTKNGTPAAPGMGDPFLALGETACLTAEGGTGKTTALFQLAVSIATRRDWLDHFYVPHHHPSGVLVLLGEEDWRQVRESLHRVYRALGLTHEDLADVERLVRFFPLKSVLAPLVRWDGKRSIVETTTHFDALRRRLEHPPEGSDGWGLVAIDPLSRFSAAGVEGDNERATQFWQHMERLPSEAPGSPSVLVAMHSSKEARRTSSVDARGVTSLTDSARHVLGMKNAGGGCVELCVQKMNYAPGWWDMMLRRTDGGLLSAESDDQRAEREARGGSADLDSLAARVPSVLQDRLGGACERKETLASMLGARLTHARAAIDLAVSLGLVRCEPIGYRRQRYSVAENGR